MTHTSKLGLALRKKFKTPRDALRALGLDENLAAPGGSNPLKEMRVDVENAMEGLSEKQIAKILEVLDKHAPFDRLDDNDPHAERARELAGDDEPVEKLRAFLRNAGLTDDDIDEGLRRATAGRATDRRNATGAFDRHLAMDAAAAASFAAFYPDSARIISDGAVADHRPLARNETREERKSFEKMYPDAARVGLSPY